MKVSFSFLTLLFISSKGSEVEIDSDGSVIKNAQVHDVEMAVTLMNSLSKPVDVYWAKSAAEEVLVIPNLPSGGSTTMNTYSNHAFVFAEAGKGVSGLLQSFIMRQGQHHYEITEESVKSSPYSTVSTNGQGRECADKKPHCALSAERGECENNPGWMIVNCPVSCNACDLLDPKVRCDRARLNISTFPIYKSGDLNHMFESIESKYKDLYDINIVSTSPWVVTFDNFMNESETNELIGVMNAENGGPGFVRSTDTGAYDKHGVAARVVSQGRTSENAWCRENCDNNPLIRSIINRIEDVLGIPYENMEQFQVLRYSPGQYYRTHHDFGPSQINLACGPRILTFFLYLSDVEEGGETSFPRLDIKVKPKRGRALLWPSVMDDDLLKQDARTHHEALPVIKGMKLAANAWVHLYNFHVPNHWGCTGAFD